MSLVSLSLRTYVKKNTTSFFPIWGIRQLVTTRTSHHPFLEIFLAPEGYLLESIVVEASSLQSGFNSITSSKLSGEALEAVSSESLGDVLSEVAGVSTLKTGQNIVKPILHGLHSNRILIINSGVRHEFQNWGSEHAPRNRSFNGR